MVLAAASPAIVSGWGGPLFGLVRGLASVPPMLSADLRRIGADAIGKWIGDTAGHDSDRCGARAGRLEWLIVRNAESTDAETAEIDVADIGVADIEAVDIDAPADVVGITGGETGRRNGDSAAANSTNVAPALGSADVRSIDVSLAFADGEGIAADTTPGAEAATICGPAPIRGPGRDSAAEASARPERIVALAIKIGFLRWSVSVPENVTGD
jgi:hypothetical protein